MTLLIAVGLLVSCSAPQLAYERLDTLAAWRLGQYVDLRADQEQRFETAFDAFWHWHRREELRAYGEDLRVLAQAARSPASAAELQSWAQRAQDHAQRSLQRAVPETCVLAASLDEGQRKAVLARIDERREADRERYVDAPVAEVQARALKRLRKQMQRWIGTLNATQDQALAQWAQSRPARYAQWIAQRRAWRDRLAAVLERRAEPDFCAALTPLVLNPGREAKSARASDANAQAWFEFLAAFSQTLEPAQREHLRAKLLELADDIDQMRAT